MESAFADQLSKIRGAAALSEGLRVRQLSDLLVRPHSGLWFSTHDDGANALALDTLLDWLACISSGDMPVPEGYRNQGQFFQSAVDPAGLALLESIRLPRQSENGMVEYGPGYTDVGGIPWTIQGDGARPWRNTYQAQDHTAIRVVDALLKYRGACIDRKSGRLPNIDRTLRGLCNTLSVVAHLNCAVPGNWHYDGEPARARSWELPVPFNFEATASAVIIFRVTMHAIGDDPEQNRQWRSAEKICLRALDAAEFSEGRIWPRFGRWSGGRIIPQYGAPDGTAFSSYDDAKVQSGYLWNVGQGFLGLMRRIWGDE